MKWYELEIRFEGGESIYIDVEAESEEDALRKGMPLEIKITNVSE